MKIEMIREWKYENFRLLLFDLHKPMPRPGSYTSDRLGYRFYWNGKLLFKGREYGPSPMHSIDGDKSVMELLSFLSLKKGDTDKEHFDDYTEEQIVFTEHEDCDTLSMHVIDMEEQSHPKYMKNASDRRSHTIDPFACHRERNWVQDTKVHYYIIPTREGIVWVVDSFSLNGFWHEIEDNAGVIWDNENRIYG